MEQVSLPDGTISKNAQTFQEFRQKKIKIRQGEFEKRQDEF